MGLGSVGPSWDPPIPSNPQAAAERSQTVILVKNLPAGTLAAELQETFGRFGSLGRVLLPEGGVTAIVEFLEAPEARRAFRQLAYSKVGWLRALPHPPSPQRPRDLPSICPFPHC